MQIHGLQHTTATQSVNSTSAAKATSSTQATESSQMSQADQLDLSPEALAISQANVSETSGIRTEKVAAIKQAIADGTYETPEKLDAALDRLLDTFA